MSCAAASERGAAHRAYGRADCRVPMFAFEDGKAFGNVDMVKDAPVTVLEETPNDRRTAPQPG